MDGLKIAQKVWRGYGIAGKKTGLPHDFYRPVTAAASPLLPANKYATSPVTFYMEQSFLAPQKYGVNVWRVFLDGNNVQVGDYLVNPDDGGTYFLISLQLDLPIQAVECNVLVDVMRPACASGSGVQPYSGSTTEASVVSNWPASMIIDGIGRDGKAALPADVTHAQWTGYLPVLPGGMEIRVRDILVNADGERYAVAANELTSLGWRMKLTRQFV